jgi:hypothetical protein
MVIILAKINLPKYNLLIVVDLLNKLTKKAFDSCYQNVFGM